MNLLPYLLSFTFLFTALLTSAQQVGAPFVRNYIPEEYKSEPQIWSSVQDHRGLMYFGVYGGVLEFDGINWRMIPVPDENIVRSLDVDKNGRVYVGSIGEFGYLKPDSAGNLRYESLIAQLDSADRQFLDVWNTYVQDDIVYFNTTNALYAYSSKNRKQPLKIIRSNNVFFLMYKVKERLFVSIMKEGLFELKDGEMHPMPHNDILSRSVTWVMLPYDNERFLFSLLREGLMVYSPNATDSANVLSQLPFDSLAIKQTNKILLESQLYHGITLSDSTFSVATISGGVIIIDKKGRITRRITKKQNLKSNTVHHLFIDKQEGLWASTAYGISHIEPMQPLSIWSETNGLQGSIYNVARHDSTFYASTNLGLYFLEHGKFKPVQSSTGRNTKQVFTLESFQLPNRRNKTLLISSPSGTFEVDGKRARLISNYFSFEFYQSQKDSSIIYMGHDNELVYIQNREGKWIQGDTLASFNESPGAFEEDNEGNLWMIIERKPCYYSVHHKKMIWPDVSVIDERIKFNDIEKYDGKLVFLTTEGFFLYEDSFVREDSFGKSYKKSDVIQFFSNSEDEVWISFQENKRNYLDVLRKEKAIWKIDSLVTRRLPQFDLFKKDGDSLAWIISPNKLFQYSLNKKFNRSQKIRVQHRSVRLNDSLLFNGAFSQEIDSLTFPSIKQLDSQKPILAYKNKDITFEFVLPSYQETKANAYRYALLESGDDLIWSAWTKETKKEYTNLWEGDYIFHVQAIDTYGQLSEVAEYSFTVMPPLYRTVLAYVIYLIGFGFFMVFLLKLNSRRMRLENERLEEVITQRTSEISKQKEEIQRQADYLQKANLQLSEKNEEINHQKEEIQSIVENLRKANGQITEQNELITDSIKYAQRIQMAVLPQKGLLKKQYPNSVVFFKPRDLVSGDFFFVKEIGDLVVLAVADCTGHGVPGAFMSMLSTALLNEIVRKTEVNSTSDVLEELRKEIKAALHQTSEGAAQKDGLDIALCAINRKTSILQFSGANIPLYLIRSNEIRTFAAVRNPIGIYLKERPFLSEEFQLEKGDVLYMSSDGYPDQFGGRKGTKLKHVRFRQLLLQAHRLSGDEQYEMFDDFLRDWQAGLHAQVDDILVMGVSI